MNRNDEMNRNEGYEQEDRDREEAMKRNASEPVPHRGENADLEDVDPKYQHEVEKAYNEQKGGSDENADERRTDTDSGSRKGMGNK